jgi:lipid-A-disaccharide synthase
MPCPSQAAPYQALGSVAGPGPLVPRTGQCAFDWGRSRGFEYTARLPRLLISCGEASADLYGAELVRHLRTEHGSLEVFGLGGDRLASQGAQLLAHIRDLAVVGLLEVVTHLRHLRRVYHRVLEEVDRRPPDAAVLVDYPDFNLRLAKQLRQRGVRVVYYVSPQVWAWRRGRLRAIRRDVSRMLVIFPFEEELYRRAGVPVRFVGHPLVDLVQPAPDRGALLAELKLAPERPVLAVLPGSRPKEIAHNLPPLAGALRLLHQRRPELQLVVAVAPSIDPEKLRPALDGLPVSFVQNRTHAVLGVSTLALVASGTATVESALLGAPMVVVYRLSPWTYHLGRHLVSVPHFAMVNLIAGQRVVPEIIQGDFTPERVAGEAETLLADPSRRQRMTEALAEVRRRLGQPGASARAAREVGALLGAAGE